MKTSSAGNRAPDSKKVRVSEILHRNSTIVPASQLKAIKQWQRAANAMPDGTTLLVLPRGKGRLQVVARRLSLSLNRQGRILTIATIH